MTPERIAFLRDECQVIGDRWPRAVIYELLAEVEARGEAVRSALLLVDLAAAGIAHPAMDTEAGRLRALVGADTNTTRENRS